MFFMRIDFENMEGEMSFNAAMICVIGMALVIFIFGLFLLRIKEKNKSSLR